jgi:chloramphenicol O-acetyltransferase type A
VSDAYSVIDVETWERGDVFAFFKAFSEPYHGVCLRVDCTATYRFAKERRISLFLALVHRSLSAAHQVDNFRLRSVDGEVRRYERINGGSAVGRSNGTIGFGFYPFDPDLVAFAESSAAIIDGVKLRTDLGRYAGADLIRYSILPWFDFTSISHARDERIDDSAPRITFGKITERDGRCTMPVSIHVHHGLVDGEHVAEFVRLFEEALAGPSSIEASSPAARIHPA